MDQDISKNTALPRVDFYLLAGEDEQAIHRFCCRLAEKAWKLDHKVFVRTEDSSEARFLDDLMWTFSEGSFLPHALETAADELTPVIIGSHSEPVQACDLLINLASDIPAQPARYKRIAEIVNENGPTRERGRLHYKRYDSENYPLHHHNINT